MDWTKAFHMVQLEEIFQFLLGSTSFIEIFNEIQTPCEQLWIACTRLHRSTVYELQFHTSGNYLPFNELPLFSVLLLTFSIISF